jgi:hypothetical protein
MYLYKWLSFYVCVIVYNKKWTKKKRTLKNNTTCKHTLRKNTTHGTDHPIGHISGIHVYLNQLLNTQIYLLLHVYVETII